MLDILGSPEDIAKQNAPVDSGSVKEAAVHEEAVCKVRGLSIVFSPRSWRQRWKFRSIRNVWDKCRATQKGRLFSDDCWRKEVIGGLKRANIVCSFAFKRHRVTLRNDESKSHYLFRCEGYCTFSTCKVTFSCYINKHLQLYAKFDGTVLHHRSEIACPYIRWSDRKTAKEVLKHKSSRLHHLERLKHLDPKALGSDCRDGCPSKDVLKQIRCEGRRIDRQDENVWLAFQKIKKDQHQESRCSATLQVIMMEPPTLIFYSMKSINVLHKVSKDDIIYIDATGNVLLGQQHGYVYEMVVQYHVEGNPPLAVVSMITCSHDISSIANFLRRVWHAQSKQGLSRPYPRLVMCDGSMALTKAIVTTLFKESLEA